MSENFDVVVIGAGPAGYVGAIRCGQLGLKTACIDAWVDRSGEPSLGGTCLNAGCIPSKALLESSEMYHKAQHELAAHGIKIDKISMDIAQMQTRKSEIVASLTGGIQSLLKANNVEVFHGKGRVVEPGKVEIDAGKRKNTTLSCKDIIIATGSEPVALSIAEFDDKQIVDSWGALEFESAPKKLGIIGAGIIGIELGSVWSRLGSEVTILEALDDFLPMADPQIAREAMRQFKKQGLDIQLGARVTGTNQNKNSVKVEYELGGENKTLNVDKLIVAVGRRPATEHVLKNSGVEADDRGFIKVDEHYRTNLEHVYAVGDAIGGAMLAHKGMEEGVAAAEIIAGQKGHVNYESVPSVIYTQPEIAWVGKTETELKQAGIEFNTGAVPFAANGRAKAMESTVGQVKIIADAHSDRILGVHMIGPYVSELIAEMVLAIEYQASAEDVARTMHAHPTLSETVHEAALSVENRAIHAINRKK